MTNKSPEVHAEKLNERVDGGGCAEAWRATSEARDGVSRRRFLRGTATVSLAVFGTGAARAERLVEDHDVYTELDDREAWGVLLSVFRTDEFARMGGHLRDEGQRLDPTEATVARVSREADDDGQDVEFDIVDVPVVGSDAVDAHAVLRRDRNADEVTQAELEYVDAVEEGVPTERRVVDVESGTDTWEWEGSPEDFETYEGDIGCTGCTAAIPIICQIGCGAGTAFICGVLTGLNVIAGGGCFTFTQVACGVISTLGCGTSAEEICSDPALDLC